MLYAVLKVLGRLAIKILCRRIQINDPSVLARGGPLLLAANHPNSFLDSVLLNLLFDRPVWALARGDAFNNERHARWLRRLNILPVYRTSEGVANLTMNYRTFDACVALFSQQQIVTIYSEALCVNEWHLRPLKKGTARLAIQTWQAGLPLTVIPVGINYSSFRLFGKNVIINFGAPITENDVPPRSTDGQRHQLFNEVLLQRMRPLVIEIDKTDTARLRHVFEVAVGTFEKKLLYIPGLCGRWFHAPLYEPIKAFTHHYFKNTGHYDSVITALLLLTYPLYMLLIASLLFAWSHSGLLVLGVVMLAPFCAWAWVRIKPQFDFQVVGR